jgi:GNAT superfamily N-acetyltransferase
MSSSKPTQNRLPVTFRPAQMDDAPTIADIHIFDRSSALDMPPSIHSPSAVHAWVARTLQSGDVTIVAESSGTVVGYARYPGENRLADLYVHLSAHGQGVGSALLEAVKEARPGGLEMWVFQCNVSTRKFLNVMNLWRWGGRIMIINTRLRRVS